MTEAVGHIRPWNILRKIKTVGKQGETKQGEEKNDSNEIKAVKKSTIASQLSFGIIISSVATTTVVSHTSEPSGVTVGGSRKGARVSNTLDRSGTVRANIAGRT